MKPYQPLSSKQACLQQVHALQPSLPFCSSWQEVIVECPTSFFHIPDQTGKDPKGDNTLDLPGTAKSVERGKHSCSRKLSCARVLSSGVMYNLAKNDFLRKSHIQSLHRRIWISGHIWANYYMGKIQAIGAKLGLFGTISALWSRL